MPRLRKLLVRLLAVIIGTVMALLFAEVGLRVARWPGPPLRSGRVAETQHHSQPSRPDFRDRGNPLDAEKPAGVRRIVVVGDSFTWGVGVLGQDAYPDVMQAELDRPARAAEPLSAEGASPSPSLLGSGPAPASPRAAGCSAHPSGVEIVNFSRPGWNTTQELGALARSFDRLSPDAIVLGYCLNDAEPHRRRELLELRRDVNPRHPETPLELFLFARSALYRLAFQRYDNYRMRRATVAYYHRFYVEGQPSWEATRHALGEMRALARDHQIPFMLVVFPIFDSQLDHRYGYHALHAEVARTAAELDIDRVDLLPRYVGIDARRLALDPFIDAHPSELGHRIAAIAILEELELRGLLAASVEGR